MGLLYKLVSLLYSYLIYFILFIPICYSVHLLQLYVLDYLAHFIKMTNG